jgi:integrase
MANRAISAPISTESQSTNGGTSMAGRQAKILAPISQQRMLEGANRHTCPARSRVIILLSVKAGLRAGEIAGLEWQMVLNADGSIADSIAIEDRIAKKRSGRRIPMHHELHDALADLYNLVDEEGPVIRSQRGGHMTANSIVNWFVKFFHDLEFDGCSSHSGRRTFVTKAAKLTHKAGASLRDVQLLVGHRSLDTTQAYIQGDTEAQRKLIALM